MEKKFIEKSTLFLRFVAASIQNVHLSTLNELLKVKKESEDNHVVISAHADAQVYTTRTKSTQTRAQSVMYYFRDHHILPERREWSEFGEQLLLNKCSDGTECPEDDHSKNRPAEIKLKKS